ncbi:MAG: hypothetical protein WDO16_13240 [Bacteroidota bacterium]
MRCINQIIDQWKIDNELNIVKEEFEVRVKNQLPDTSFDIYISSGGPGDPLSSRFDDWDINWNKWLNEMERWNNNPSNTQKKHIFFICHSFQLASRYFNAGILTKENLLLSAYSRCICWMPVATNPYLMVSVILFMR